MGSTDMGDTRISAQCPGCGAEYLLDAALLGQNVRCPARLCGCVFVVVAESKAHDDSESEPRSARVSDVVPLLSAKEAPAPVLEQEPLPPPILTCLSDVVKPLPESAARAPAAGEPLSPHQRLRLLAVCTALLLLLLVGVGLVIYPNKTHKNVRQAPSEHLSGPKSRSEFVSSSAEFPLGHRLDRLLSELDALAADPRRVSYDTILRAQQLIKAESKLIPEIVADERIRQRLDLLCQAHLEQVRYEAATPDLPALLALSGHQSWPGLLPTGLLAWLSQSGPFADSESSLLPTPLVAGAPLHAAPGEGSDRPIPVLARGMFHVFSANTGQLYWATRVSIDTAALPVHVPATTGHSEIYLVVDPETGRVSALDAWSGRSVWHCWVGAPCLARPLVHEDRAFVPTTTGLVCEVDLISGRLLGQFRLGMPIKVGGQLQAGSHLAYFVGDEGCVFVLDLEHRLCPQIVYTGHSRGSVRIEPVVVACASSESRSPDQALLVLFIADGLSATQIEVIALPQKVPFIRMGELSPAPVSSVRVDGCCWSRPYCDAERLILATDAGKLAVVGFTGPRARDPRAYRVCPDFSLDVPKLGQSIQLVHVDDNEIYLLVGGALRCVELVFDSKSGWKMVERKANSPLYLGAALHDAQVHEVRQGGQSMTLAWIASRDLHDPTCRLSAIDLDAGAVRWQRQIGVQVQGSPLTLEDGDRSWVLVQDHNRSVFRFEAGRAAFGGRMIGPPFRESEAGPSFLLPARQSTMSAYQMCCLKSHLFVRQTQQVSDGISFSDWTEHELAAPIAGVPVAGPSGILVPLSDGSLIVVKVREKQGTGNRPASPELEVSLGPSWCSRKAVDHVVCHTTWLNDKEFVTTNGDRGLNRWRLSDDRWQAVPPGATASNPSVEFSQRLVGEPLVLGDGALCVGLADGTVQLCTGERWQTTARKWDIGGEISSGPFHVDTKADRVGCIVSHRRLLFFSTQSNSKPMEAEVGGPILGLPQILDDNRVVITTASGRYVILEAATGRAVGRGYALKAAVAPTADAVPLGKAARDPASHLLAPLSDGSVLPLPMEWLK